MTRADFLSIAPILCVAVAIFQLAGIYVLSKSGESLLRIAFGKLTLYAGVIMQLCVAVLFMDGMIDLSASFRGTFLNGAIFALGVPLLICFPLPVLIALFFKEMSPSGWVRYKEALRKDWWGQK